MAKGRGGTTAKPGKSSLTRAAVVLDAPAIITGVDETPDGEPWEATKKRIQIAVQNTLASLDDRAGTIMQRWQALTEVPEAMQRKCLLAYKAGLLESGSREMAARPLGLPVAVLEQWLSQIPQESAASYARALLEGRGRLADRIEALLLDRAVGNLEVGAGAAGSAVKDTTLLTMLQALRPEWRANYDADDHLQSMPDIRSWPAPVVMHVMSQIREFLAERGIAPAHATLIEHAAGASHAPANGSGQSADARRKALPRTRDDLKRYEGS